VKPFEQPNTNQTVIEKRHIDRLFDKLIQMYATEFTYRFGAVDSENLWLSALKHLHPDEIKSGLEKMVAPGTKYIKWPPNPIEFRELCRPSKPDTSHRTHHEAYKEFTGLALPKLADRETAAKALREMRFKVGTLR
jgi:hypothetical protein